jgi:uncharacterized protein (TIGR00661 family)
MKILYSVQATGNGHISRAMELLPHLQLHGNVDIFLSGNNSSLQLDAPVKYRSKGLSLYYSCNGSLSYWKTFKKMEPLRIKKEINDLPVEKYDLVIKDFEYITSAACAKKKIPSVNFGHQASFLSPNTPRPARRNAIGEWLLRNYGKASSYIGLHFDKYDDFIFTPVVKKEILEADSKDNNYITVYLPSFCEKQLLDVFSPLKDFRFEIFCSHTRMVKQFGPIKLMPVKKKLFNQSLINCTGIITGGGFETPAEALQLNKKIMSIPIGGQYEQQCNVAAMHKLGVYTLDKIDRMFPVHFYEWINKPVPVKVDYSNSIPESLSHLFSRVKKKEMQFVDTFFNNDIDNIEIPQFTF